MSAEGHIGDLGYHEGQICYEYKAFWICKLGNVQLDLHLHKPLTQRNTRMSWRSDGLECPCTIIFLQGQRGLFELSEWLDKEWLEELLVNCTCLQISPWVFFIIPEAQMIFCPFWHMLWSNHVSLSLYQNVTLWRNLFMKGKYLQPWFCIHQL